VRLPRPGFALGGTTIVPVAALAVTVLAFLVTPFVTSSDIAVFDVFNTFQAFSSLGLVTLAIGLTMLAGEFDVSVAGMQALGGVLAVKAGVHSGLAGVAAAVAVCATLGALQGLAIAKFRIQSMPVTLGTYIALLGATNVLAGGNTVSFSNADASVWVDQPLASWISARGAVAVVVFGLVLALLAGTQVGVNLRAIGADRRASRVVGVRVDRYLVVLFAGSGGLAACGGAMLAYSNSTATLDPGVQPLILAVAGAVLGGVSLAGGRGTVWGLLLGALAVSLLQEIFAVTSLATSTTQLVFGALLVAVVILDAPGLRLAGAGIHRFTRRAG
jgi:ribose transport system permease protein